MAESLAKPVAALIKKSPSYISKKACLCGYRIITKDPSHIELFANAVQGVLNDKNHGLLLSAITLALKIIEMEPERKESFIKYIPHLVIHGLT